MADSMAISVVASVISLSAPPMTPAMPMGPSESAMIRVSGVSSRSTWSSVSRRSPGSARRTMIVPSVDRGAVERVSRLAQLEHDVVGRVDDVADGPHAGRLQPHLDAVRRRPDLRAADPAADEAGAQLRLADLDAEPLGDRAAGLLDADLGPADGGAGGGRDFSGQADQAQRVAAIRLDVNVQDDVAVQIGELPAEGRVRGQDQDPLGVGGDVQLVTGAEHPLRGDAHLLGPLDAPIARQDGSGQGHRHALAGGDVVGAADDVERLARADVDGREMQPIGIGVLLDGQQLTDDDGTPVGAPLLDPLDLHAEQRQAFGQLLGGLLDVDVLAQPAQRNSHRNCSRKRRSFSR